MKDEFLEEAKEWSRKQGFVSVGSLQRILRIGYIRAAHLVDLMIEDKFCGEYVPGTGHRQITEAIEQTLASDGGQAARIPSDMDDLYPRFGQSNAEARRLSRAPLGGLPEE